MRRQSEWPFAAGLQKRQIKNLKRTSHIAREGFPLWLQYLQHESESTWDGCHWANRRPPELKAPPRSERSLSAPPGRAQSGRQRPACPHRLPSLWAHAGPASGPDQPAGGAELVSTLHLVKINKQRFVWRSQRDEEDWLECCSLCLQVH